MALFNADSYQEVSIDWLTVTLKTMISRRWASNVAHPSDHGMSDRLIAYIEHKLTYQDQMKSRRKNTNKGYN